MNATEMDNIRNGSFATFAKIWIENGLRRKDISVRVREEYESILQTRVLPRLGKYKLSEISAFELDALVDELRGRGYAAKTIKNTMSVVHLIFQYAYKKGFLDDDPCRRMDDLPRDEALRPIRCFTLEQAKIFLKCLERQPLPVRTFFTLMLYGGFRRGELCAVCWDDIDFYSGTLNICRAISQTREGQIIKEPKTKSSVRMVSLPTPCIALLRQYKASLSGPLPRFVFTNKSGTSFINPHIQTRRFREIVDSYNASGRGRFEPLPRIRLHDLRHTSATLLVSSGTDVVTISHRLGHANPSVTLDIYSHYLPQTDRAAAQTLACILE